jgi:hypothetical protein
MDILRSMAKERIRIDGNNYLYLTIKNKEVHIRDSQLNPGMNYFDGLIIYLGFELMVLFPDK